MEGTRTSLLDLTDPKKNKDFFFDYSFWSHDGFELNEEGFVSNLINFIKKIIHEESYLAYIFLTVQACQTKSKF